jgi:putative MATE family efflux protein
VEATVYLRIIFIGLFFMIAYNSFGAIMRGLGDSVSPLYFLIISSVLNAFLAFLFVAKLHWGIAGAAWATVIAQGFSSLLCIIYIYFKVPLLRFKKGEFVFDKGIFKKIFSLGMNTGLQQTILSVGFLFVQGIVNIFGSTTIAAVTAALRIDSIATLPIMTLGIAVTSYTGQNIGAGEIERVKKGYRASILISLIMCAFTAGFILLFGSKLIGLFSADSEVVKQGVEYIVFISFFYFIFGLMFATNGVLRGSGDVVFPTVSTLAALAFRIIGAFSLIPFMGYKSIWWSIPIGWIVGITFALARYSTGKWKTKSVIKS